MSTVIAGIKVKHVENVHIEKRENTASFADSVAKNVTNHAISAVVSQIIPSPTFTITDMPNTKTNIARLEGAQLLGIDLAAGKTQVVASSCMGGLSHPIHIDRYPYTPDDYNKPRPPYQMY